MTKLDKPLRRELDINGAPHVIVITPQGLKLTAKGKRRGLEFAWTDLVRGDTAPTSAVSASLEVADE